MGDGAKPSQFASLARSLERAREHSCESQSLETFSESPRHVFAMLSEGEVGESSVLARQTPGGFTVPRQINYGKFVFHRVLFPTSGVATRSVRQFPEATPEDLQKSVRASRRQQALSGPQLFKSRQPLRLRDIKLTWDASDGVAGDQELFVGWNYKCMQMGIIRTDLAF